MPELPEVETVRAGLLWALKLPQRIQHITIRQPLLRRPVPSHLAKTVTGQTLTNITRRAKYLLWYCDTGVLLNHLGMTGSWRLEDDPAAQTHDHVIIELESGQRLIYRDPRRFGVIDWVNHGDVAAHPSLIKLGPEPWDPAFNAAALKRALIRRPGPIKSAIMDQQVVVGVGNIYAAEALFRSGINPLTSAQRISQARLARLISAIRQVLDEAIAAGGSTIRDFRQAGGSSGYFQHRFAVYGRAGQACQRCASPIASAVIGGRASCWCPRCQAR